MRIAVAVIISAVANIMPAVAEDRYIFDVAGDPISNPAYIDLVADAAKEDPWLMNYDAMNVLKNYPFTVNGQAFERVFACNKPSCDADRILIIASVDGKQMWARYRDGGAERLLGNPDSTMTGVLESANMDP